eukprot:scaffold7790_cov68-Phaeocystis_antarctica.AAC.2
MKTSRPVDARLWAAREAPGLQSELGAEYTRPTGGCHEHAARFGHPQVTGEGPGCFVRDAFHCRACVESQVRSWVKRTPLRGIKA